MSQSPYPSPYAVPPSDPSAFMDPYRASAAHLRASVMMFVLGGLMSLLGLCNFTSALTQSADELLRNQQKFMPQNAGAPPISGEMLRGLSIAVAAVILLIGLTMIGLGTAVRRGASNAAVIGAIVITSAMLLLTGLFSLLVTVAGLLAPMLIACACASLLPLGLLLLQLVWLIQAARSGSQARLAMAQYQGQYWQYQQAMQAYQTNPAAGYGYPTPPTQAPVQPQPPPEPGADHDRNSGS